MSAHLPTIVIDLSTPEGYEASLALGEPLELMLRLRHADRGLVGLSSPAIHIGSDDSPWQQSLQFLQESRGRWVNLDWPLEPVDPPRDATLTVDVQTTWTLRHDLAPAAMTRIPAGRYRIKAGFDLHSDDGDVSARVESNVLTIDVTGQAAPDLEEHLLGLAQYCSRHRKYDQQAEYARQVLEVDPASPTALFYLGLAEEGMGHLAEALRLYEAALREFNRQFPDSYEKPEIVVTRIVEVRARLRAAKDGTR